MFWGSRTSSYNVVTFWLKLASTFYALFFVHSIVSWGHDQTAMLLAQTFLFLPYAFEGFILSPLSANITSPYHIAPAAPGRRCYGQRWWAPGIFT